MSCLDCPDLNFFLNDALSTKNVGDTMDTITLDPFATANVISSDVCPGCLFDDSDSMLIKV